MTYQIKIALLLTLMITTTTTYAASFNCAKASNNIEHLICGDKKLSVLDEDLLKVYKQAKKNSDASKIKNEQKSWIKFTRNECSTIECLKTVYKKRIEKLKKYKKSSNYGNKFKWEGDYESVGNEGSVGSYITIKKNMSFQYDSSNGAPRYSSCRVEGTYKKSGNTLLLTGEEKDQPCSIIATKVDSNTININIIEGTCLSSFYCGMSVWLEEGHFKK